MKIIISPAKTMDFKNSAYLEDKQILFPKQTKELLLKLSKLNSVQLGKALNIKGKILDYTYNNINNYDNLEQFHAFTSFNGLVYKNLRISNYKEDDYLYIKDHIRVLDAFYGIIEPGTLIRAYRLDMKAKLGMNLYKYWQIDSYFNSEVIINLASKEFSKILNLPMINITFFQEKDGKFVNQATYSKIARGLFLDYMIKNKIKSINKLKQFNLDKYAYNSDLSDNSNFVYTRNR